MIDMKTEVTSALSFVNDVYEPDDVQNARLEEVELSQDNNHWYVTISIEARPSSAQETVAGVKGRDFKVIEVWANTGKVHSMRIGTLS